MRTGPSLAGKRQVKRAIKANMRWEGRRQKQMWLQEEIRRSILQGQKRWPMRDKEKRIAVMMSRPLGGHGHQSLPPRVHASFSCISATLILFRDGNIPSSKSLHKQPQFWVQVTVAAPACELWAATFWA